jgi:iron complex transport system substrate-binding protein
MKRLTFLLLMMLGLTVGGALAQAAPAANLTDGCVTDYDPTVDYFPDKVTVEDATNFSVAYFNNYKVVTVLDAFDNAPTFDYVLVQCGTPAPDADDFPAGTQFIEVPVSRFIAMSTTQLPHLTQLGLLDALIGLDSFLFVSSPEVQALIDAGELVEIGSGAGVNVELVLDVEPDVVMTYGFSPEFDAHPKLLEAGIFTALNAEWREASPLGRAEWIKYTALFFNAEAAANDAYGAIVDEYEAARQLVADIPLEDRPVVLMNTFSSFGNAWSIPGAQTFVGALVRDAGGVMALGELAPEDSAQLSFEAVYDGALDADIWIAGAFGVSTLDDLLAQDSRYADFSAVANGQVWNNDRDVNPNGGNNYFELGVTNPQLVLRDLIAIFHPDVLPDHEFLFHRRLLPSGQ